MVGREHDPVLDFHAGAGISSGCNSRPERAVRTWPNDSLGAILNWKLLVLALLHSAPLSDVED